MKSSWVDVDRSVKNSDSLIKVQFENPTRKYFIIYHCLLRCARLPLDRRTRLLWCFLKLTFSEERYTDLRRHAAEHINFPNLVFLI